MHPKRFANVSGVIMLLMGGLALIPALSQYPAELPPLSVESSYGLFLNFIPMNIFNKLLLIVLGLVGIGAARSATNALPNSIAYARLVLVVMGVASILGMSYATDTLGGYYPLFGSDVWIHGVFALLGAYFGFSLRVKARAINQDRFPDEKQDSLLAPSSEPSYTADGRPLTQARPFSVVEESRKKNVG